jgi:integrase
MPLTDIAIRNARAKEKPYKLTDQRGLFMLVQPSGAKLWRYKFQQHGKEKKLSLGIYPDVTLAKARKLADTARDRVLDGNDPVAEKKLQKAAAVLSAATTFEGIADEYIAKTEREGRSEATVSKSRWLLDIARPLIGSRPIADIKPIEVLAVLKKLEARGNLETAKRMRSFSSRVFRYAIATARAENDPASLLIGAISAPVRKHHAAIVEPVEVAKLLRAIEGYTGQPVTRIALSLNPHVFVRPGELRHAEWSEIDWEKAVWHIPASKMKSRVAHAVPLSRQAVDLLREIEPLTCHSRYVFPSLRTPKEPMSENTINGALRRLGYSGDEMTAHGFRATASTLLNESGKWHPDAIERALAHKDSDNVRAAYHRGAHWEERVRMAQWWSDYLDTLREGATVIPITRGRR